jgi:phage terminase Nu1 subunit (DNA packaging protein)
VSASSFPREFQPERSASGVIVAPEPYVDRKQLAELMGVSVATIDRMVRAGMPSETWGIRSRRFRLSSALAWARAREVAR